MIDPPRPSTQVAIVVVDGHPDQTQSSVIDGPPDQAWLPWVSQDYHYYINTCVWHEQHYLIQAMYV